ncbi:MAG: efflux RND transporter periplasmic adaptor subunit [Anaerolineales bacterium]|nr:efflux RND transporter periplasmic adaptor subunit [Anaerolineales bacterium]
MRKFVIAGAVVVLIIAAVLVVRQLRRGSPSAENGFQTEAARLGSLTASVGGTGTVRSNQTATLNWQTSGTVESVEVASGDLVTAGAVLAGLAETSLPQNVILARSELVSAQQALNDLLESSQPQALALQSLDEARENLENLTVSYAGRQAQVQLALANAEDDLEDTEYRWRVQQEGNRASGETIDAAEANLVLAESEVDAAQQAFNRVSNRASDDPVRALALSNLSAAKQRRDSVLRQLNWYLGKPSAIDQAILDAEVAQAQAQVEDLRQQWQALQDGPDDAARMVLEAQLADAEREWERLKNGPDPADIAAAEARVAAAQATLRQVRIEAPFDGTITEVQVKEGDLVSPGMVAFRLDDLSSLLVDVEVSEIDINRIKEGQRAVLTFDAILGKEYMGEVVEVGTVGNTLQGTVNFRVSIELSDPDDEVKAGMTAAVNVLVDELTDVLLVPNRAVRVRDGRRVVFVLEDGVPVAVEVTLGASSGDVSEVLNGDLEAGDPVVLNPPSENNFFGPGGGGGGGF